MLNVLFTNYDSAIFIGAVLVFVFFLALFSGKKGRRKEKGDPPAIFGPIRGMFVCYQCDTIFNTTLCPVCHEEASIPLILLTGSIVEDERVAAVTNRLKARANWKLTPLQIEQAIHPASVANSSNGDAPVVPVTFLYTPERSRELS